MKVAVGQFGAPTAVLNASLYGVLETLHQENTQVYGICGGAYGLSKGDLVSMPADDSLEWLLRTPGAALAAGRQSDFGESVDAAVRHLQQANIDALMVLGGNGTMALGQAMEQHARARGYGLHVIGVPKTIDNDIVGVDHTPGYPSAAQFVLKALRDLAVDLEAMVGFEQVRVVEVMGRGSGWLAAVAALYPEVCAAGENNIHPIICLPEQTFQVNALIAQVQERVRQDGCTMVIVSEGVQLVNGESVLQTGMESTPSPSLMLGGIGAWVAHAIRTHTGYGTRYENLGLLQRCWIDSSVPLDVMEAAQLGREGARRVLGGETGCMVGLARETQPTYETKVITLPFAQVASTERVMTGTDVQLGSSFRDWLRPLLNWSQLAPHPRLRSKLACREVDAR